MKRSRTTYVTLAMRNVPLVLFVVILAGFGLFAEGFSEYRSLENIVKQASYIGIVAVGITFVLLTAGIDLSVGSNMYLSAVVAGLLMDKYQVGLWPALGACLAVGLLFGTVNALAVAKLKIIPFVATLSTMVAGRGLALMLTESREVSFPDSVVRIGSIQLFGLIPLPVAIFGLVVLIAHVFLRWTMLGRQIYAVGDNKEAAQKAGIRVNRVLVSVYLICGLLAALGGFVSVAQLGNVNSGFAKGDEFDAIAAAVLGGTSLFGGMGSVFPGTVLGAVLIRMVSAGLVAAQVNLYLQPMVSAAIIFVAVFLDSFRNRRLAQLGRRRIRAEEIT
ncbi:MAG: ABC transporter permease [Phycisphaerales bacterium]|nr:MAG: ABC transporter permease [Phycisphaerales bacterium]